MKYTQIRATILIALTLATSNIYAQIPAAAPAPLIQTVWVVDNKNTLFFREGISPQNVLGTVWKEIPGIKIMQIAAGSCGNVWAISETRQLLFREGITPSTPAGTGWKIVDQVTGFVEIIIGGPNDSLVWARDGNSKVFRRIGITPGNPIGTGWVQVPKIDARSVAISPEGDVWHLGFRWQPFQYLYVKVYHARDANFSGWDHVFTEPIDCSKIVLDPGKGLWVLIATKKKIFFTTREYYELRFHPFVGQTTALQPTSSLNIQNPRLLNIATNKGGDVWGIKLGGTVVARQGDTWTEAGNLEPCVQIAVGSLPYAAQPAVEKPIVEKPAIEKAASAEKLPVKKSPVKNPPVKKKPLAKKKPVEKK
ncbi:MAG: tectonin domain-containing protein [Candidatus Babeliales bacterium]|jgi:hypothetical protein